MKSSEQKAKKSHEIKHDVKIEDTSLSKEKPPSPTKDLIIDPTTGTSEEALKRFMPIIEMVVKKEYKSIPSYLAEYGELINVGLVSVNKLLKDVAKNKKTYNSSYIAQAVKWAIKDELRTKYGWYGVKQSVSKEKQEEAYENDSEYPREIANEKDLSALSHEEANERVFESILYLDDFNREIVSQDELTTDELAKLELMELKLAVKRAVDKLPEKHKRVIEMRFYEGKRGNDIATWLGVTPSRVSHMIQDAIEKVKQSLTKEGFC